MPVIQVIDKGRTKYRGDNSVAARDYATANGLTIIREYVDRAATGRNDNRTAFQEMLKIPLKINSGLSFFGK